MFPPVRPYATLKFVVDKLHTLSVRQYGNPLGKPVLFVHGGKPFYPTTPFLVRSLIIPTAHVNAGPGGGCDDSDAQRFDPEVSETPPLSNESNDVLTFYRAQLYRIVLFDQRGKSSLF